MPAADAGEYRELRSRSSTVSITTSVYAFAREQDAIDAFATSKNIAEGCPTTATYTSQDGTFAPSASPTIQNAGDDAFTLFARETDTGLLVGDHFVRRNRYIFDIRFAVSGSSAVDVGTLATVATEANREFVSWADDH